MTFEFPKEKKEETVNLGRGTNIQINKHSELHRLSGCVSPAVEEKKNSSQTTEKAKLTRRSNQVRQ